MVPQKKLWARPRARGHCQTGIIHKSPKSRPRRTARMRETSRVGAGLAMWDGCCFSIKEERALRAYGLVKRLDPLKAEAPIEPGGRLVFGGDL